MTIDSKAAIPYGDNLDYVDPFSGVPIYNWNPTGSGQAVYRNRAVCPVDAVNNPQGSGYMAELLQGSSDPAKLSVYSGVHVDYDMAYTLTAGNVYTVSVWVQSAFLGGGNAIMTALGSGNWTTGLQTAGSEGNFSDPSWGFLNGSVTIIQSAVTGNDGKFFTGGCGDLGIPQDITYYYPSRQLFPRRGDHIRAVSANGASSLLVMDTLNAQGTVFDLSIPGNLTPMLAEQVNSVLVYQSILPASSVTSVLVDAWMRIAQEANTSGGTVTINPSITGNVTGYGMVFTDTTGRQIVQVYRSYLSFETHWILQGNTFSTAPTFISRDTTKPVGFGFFITGDLAIYGGLRIQDNSTLHHVNPTTGNPVYTTIHTGAWSRISLTFTAHENMADTTLATYKAGFSPSLQFTTGYITLGITAYMPGVPKLGNGSNDPAYQPWCPYWGSVYLYGLWINDGSSPTPYLIDAPPTVVSGTGFIPSMVKCGTPGFSVPAGQTQIAAAGPPPIPMPKHNLGINVGGNTWFSTAMIFLNLVKMSSCSRYRAGIDPTGVMPTTRQCGWFIAKPSTYTMNTVGSAMTLTGVSYVAGNSFFLCPVASNPNWNLVDTGWPDRTIIPIVTGDVTTGTIVNANPALLSYDHTQVKFTVSHPFLNSNPGTAITVKRFAVDDWSYLNLNENGYPTTIPAGYIPFGLAYWNVPAWPYGIPYTSGQFNSPFLASGHYVLKWDGTGTATLLSAANVLAGSSGGYPMTVVSSSPNRVVYDVDCSGNTANGTPCVYPYFLPTDANVTDILQSRTGFVIAITATSPTDPVRNLRLVEAQYEALLDSGEVFYPSWMDRLANYRTIRFLDWDQVNNFYPYIYDINQKPNVDDVSYASKYSHVPWELMIQLCNRLGKNAWINLHPSSPPDLVAWLANLFLNNLDPRLRIYLEYGNEPWNGGMTGKYFSAYAITYNVNPAPNAPNPSWNAMEYAYAMLAQQAFTIWESVFSGVNGLLQPVQLAGDPKWWRKRIIRMCSCNDGGWSNAQDLYAYGAIYTTNPHGRPFDAVNSNCYNNDMAGGYYQSMEALQSPYPWTMSETIALLWSGLAKQNANCSTMHQACMTNKQVLGGGGWGAANTFLGLDADGDPMNPAYCIYEGGSVGSPGASKFMLYNLIQIKFELDGMGTCYSNMEAQFAWWNNEVAIETNELNQEIMCWNLYESPKNWLSPDQWGVADKSYYPDYQYNGFPLQRAVSVSAGEFRPGAIVEASFTPLKSAPMVMIDGQWVHMNNVYQWQNGQWVMIPASCIHYFWGGRAY